MFSNNVNSPHKVPPNQNNQGPANHHSNINNTPPPKRSNSNAIPGSTTTPGTTRPQNRRRETSDAALTGSPFTSTPPQVPRRRTELREAEEAGGRDRNTLFGRWGSAGGTSGQPGEDDHKDKGADESSGTGGRNTGLFRRGSAAWPSGATGGSGFASSGALNSPMGSFGNGTFGGAMGGFSLQSTSGAADKAKPGTVGSKGSSAAPPKVEDVEEEDDDVNRVVSQAAGNSRDEEERERPMSSDTDPFGDRDRDRDDHGQGQEHHSPHSTMADPHLVKNSSSFGNLASASMNPPRGGNNIATPTKVRNDLGFSGLGGSREGLGGLGGMGSGGLHQQLQNLQLNQHGNYPLHGRSRQGSLGGMVGGLNENEPLSPTETNPYQSPAPEKADEDDINDMHGDGGHGGGIIGGGFKRDVGAPGSDRSGRSSTAGLGGVGGGLSGFGSLSGSALWGGQVGTPGGLGSSTTPGSFFGGGVLGDLSSPGGSILSGGGMGGIGSIGSGGPFGSASRGSRLAQMFPPEQQQQMEDEQSGFEPNDGFGDLRFGGFGSRRGFGGTMDSPMRERGDVSDLFAGLHTTRSLGNLGAVASGDSMFSREREDSFTLGNLHQQGQSGPMGSGIQPPMPIQAQQIRPPPGTVPPQPQTVLVMPDKIQWTYRDPSGTIQGPFSGLEMHDWYKAGFFTQELAVKRVEDHDFEPLGQLVRRIGNTREPFLVPLQAPPGTTVPATAPVAPTPNAWPGWLETQQPGTVQPPFAGSFPSFGTTLTADQQNALERRKQEEQYLLARQREYLVQQQVYVKAQQAVLHHQHSQQSLHSQPSYGSLQGSLQSPGGFATPTASAPAVGVGVQNAFEPGVLLRQAGAAAGGGDAFGVGGHNIPGLSGQQMQPGNQFLQQQVHSQAQLQLEQQQKQILEMQRQQMQRTYQNQHQQVEKQQELEQAQQQIAAAVAQAQQQAQNQGIEREEERLTHEHHEQIQDLNEKSADDASGSSNVDESHWEPESERKSPMPPKVQPAENPKVNIPKGLSTKTSPVPKQAQPAAPISPWQEIEQPLVQPFPPPPGSSQPASELAVSAPPMTRSPSVETPHTSTSVSIAPWANKENEVKGPSLKEIQELEAKQQQARDAAEAEQKRLMLLQQVNIQPPPPAPGLPSTATWATSPSGTPSSGQASAWAKPLVKANTLPAGGAKKTLQQIQKEEELRKAKAAAAAQAAQAIQSAPSHPANIGGKRYADLAGKAQVPPPINTVGGVWTTVGPGGKSKNLATSPIPTAPAQTLKTMTSAPALALAPTPVKKVMPTLSAPKPASTSANEEFMKWCKANLKGLTAGLQGNSNSYVMPIPRTILTFHPSR